MIIYGLQNVLESVSACHYAIEHTSFLLTLLGFEIERDSHYYSPSHLLPCPPSSRIPLPKEYAAKGLLGHLCGPSAYYYRALGAFNKNEGRKLKPQCLNLGVWKCLLATHIWEVLRFTVCFTDMHICVHAHRFPIVPVYSLEDTCWSLSMVLQGLRHTHLLLHRETLEQGEAGFFRRFVPQDLSGSYINLSISFYFSNGNWATFRETFLKSVPTHGSSHLHLPFSSPCPALPSPPSIFCQPCFVQIVTSPRMNLECLDFEIWAPTLRKMHISWCTMTLCDLSLPQELPVWWVQTSFCCGKGSRKTGSKSL